MVMPSTPYEDWLVSQEDYRAPFTQNEDFVRDVLGGADYALSSNRVNLGAYYNTRRALAEQAPELPHYYGNMDRFGWQDWLKSREESAAIYGDLREVSDVTVKGTRLETTSRVQHRHCSTCARPRPRRPRV